ncbi:MAG TPA: tripartite tricarboxylate transporter substrate binding protein [Casimicrobiaceae bacterium]|nr:tripartite tricarboxylate transporter substrate binding protein [Casimicrobiaceae bacterium]
MSAWPCRIGVLAMLTMLATVAASQPTTDPYPSRPLRLVVPYSPGAHGDNLGRAIAERLGEFLGQPIIVENRAGAGAAIGAEFVAKAPADGYTLLLAGSSVLTLASVLVKDQRYGLADFTPIGPIARVRFALAVHPDVPVKTMGELIDFARAHPGTLNYASAGSGSSSMLFFELMKLSARIDIVHVPYKGSAPALRDLLAGRVHLIYADLSLLSPYQRDGSLRIIAIAGLERSPAAPDAATMAEQGYGEWSIEPWHGLFVRAATPPHIVARLAGALRATIRTEEVRSRFEAAGYVPMDATPEELDQTIRRERRAFETLVGRVRITP